MGLALDLWNQVEFMIIDHGFIINVQGEGENEILKNQDNLIYKAFSKTYQKLDSTPPNNLEITCQNAIPLASGLGSSAAATLLGIMGANSLLGNPLNNQEMIELGTEIEGHPDNIAPSLLGGCTISLKRDNGILTEKIQTHPWKIVVVLPEFELSTETARDALPEQVTVSDAVSNIGNSLLVAQALQKGDLQLLKQAMVDTLHQPYRVPLIPGAAEAILSAQEMGAAAALSGAGPSVIAFTNKHSDKLGESMAKTFSDAGLDSRIFNLDIENHGAFVL
jgi:homoserine kinase